MPSHYEIPGPVWHDGCKHGKKCYIASFSVIERRQGQTVEDKYDLYLFESDTIGQEACLRYGDQDPEYYSPTNVVQVFLTPHEPYVTAAKVLLGRGRIRWAPHSST